MPTTEQLLEYSKTLPELYRHIFAAFPAMEPGRRSGFGLAFGSLLSHFTTLGLPYGLPEILEACRQLEANGFVEVKNGVFASPTPLGEQMIGAITGRWASAVGVPDLPKPDW